MGCGGSKPEEESTTTSPVAQYFETTCEIPAADAKLYADALASAGFDVVSSLKDIPDGGWPPAIKAGHLARIKRVGTAGGVVPMAQAGDVPMGEVVPTAMPAAIPAAMSVQVAVPVGPTGMPLTPTAGMVPGMAAMPAMPVDPGASTGLPMLHTETPAPLNKGTGSLKISFAPDANNNDQGGDRRNHMRNRKPISSMTMIDLCFVMDCTGSMGSYIEEARKKVEEVMREVETRIAQGKELRIAFVGYRDFGDDGHIVTFDFSRDAAKCRDFIGSQRASGGGDMPEDCLGGLRAASELSWGDGTNLIIWLADAPNHGLRFHESNIRDSHVDAEDISESVLLALKAKKVDIHFVALNSSTDKMFAALKSQYDTMRQGRMWQHDMKTRVSDFLPTVIKSLRQSMVAGPLSQKV